MKLKSLSLTNWACFEGKHEIKFHPQINLLVGKNNSGKSAILRAVGLAQEGVTANFGRNLIRCNCTLARIRIELEELDNKDQVREFKIEYEVDKLSNYPAVRHNNYGFVKEIDARQLNNGQIDGNRKFGYIAASNIRECFIVPYFSKRKVAVFDERISQSLSDIITVDMKQLPAIVDDLCNPIHPKFDLYKKYCLQILGFLIGATGSENGKKVGAITKSMEKIFLDEMGEGVAHIIYLITLLLRSKNKLFLIEEPENDLHPQALKALLELIKESAENNGNQFIISTHSNIVLRYLGGENIATIYKIEQKAQEDDSYYNPSSEIKQIETEQERVDLLIELGYSFSDFSLWEAWLFLEESSAQKIIQSYLIPKFAPQLQGRLFIYSSAGNSKVEPAFDDFHRLMVFVHLEGIYNNRAWVKVDGDEEGKKIVGKIQDKFPTWDKNRFSTFLKTQFEEYYPAKFEKKVQEILQIEDKAQKRDEKKKLLKEVLEYLKSSGEEGKKEIAESAQEVISFLQEIEKALPYEKQPNKEGKAA